MLWYGQSSCFLAYCKWTHLNSSDYLHSFPIKKPQKNCQVSGKASSNWTIKRFRTKNHRKKMKGRRTTVFPGSGILICILSLILISCSFRDEETLFADEVCDTTGEDTYISFVRPIIENRCASCHNAIIPSGSVDLGSFDKLKVQIENGKFLGVIKHSPGFPPMPNDGSKLSDCILQRIETWIIQGFPENWFPLK